MLVAFAQALSRPSLFAWGCRSLLCQGLRALSVRELLMQELVNGFIEFCIYLPIGFRTDIAPRSIIFLIAGTSSSEALFLLTYSVAPARSQRNAYWLSAWTLTMITGSLG